MGGTSLSRICVPSCVPRAPAAGWACVRLPPPPPASILCLCAGQGAFPPPIAPLLDSPCVRLRGGLSTSTPASSNREGAAGLPAPPPAPRPSLPGSPAALSGAGPGARAAPGRRRLSLPAARSGAAAGLRWRRRCAGGRGVAGTPAEVRPGRRGQGAHGGAGAPRGARHRPGGEPQEGLGAGKGDLGSWGSGRVVVPRRDPPGALPWPRRVPAAA